MATVTGFTAERMLEIENETIVDGNVVGNDLILVTREGTQINAGNVRGPQGDTGPPGPLTQAQADALYVNLTGDTMTGVLDFGSVAREMLKLNINNYGIGVQTNTEYFRVPAANGQFAWYKGGVHSDTSLDPGSGGAELMELTSTGLAIGRHMDQGSPLALFGTQGDAHSMCYMKFLDGDALTRMGYMGFSSISSPWLVIRNEKTLGSTWLQAQDVLMFSCGTAYEERMRITKDGMILLGKSATGWNSNSGFEIEAQGRMFTSVDTAGVVNMICNKFGGANASGQAFISFYTLGAGKGSISYNGTGVTYNTTSDYRLKDDRGEITDGLARINQLRPIKVHWKSEPEDKVVDGFFAHEVQAVVPEAVTGEKDAVIAADDPRVVDERAVAGEPDYQQIDTSYLIPLLVAAVKELSAEVAELKTLVTAK